ncbi:cobalamin biosynthesis protein [Pseudomonas sp. DC3200b2]|uniref:cobalamin biosynthesis protein n=1 Tax=Pseudomonas sp. DC3200b2 TaxID=2804669 RepID=UPI003CED6FFC
MLPDAAALQSPPACLVAGFGCRQACSDAELRALLDRALAVIKARPCQLLGLATLDRRLAVPGLQALAQELGLALAGYDAQGLGHYDGELSHRSALTWRYTGCHGIAEASALAHCRALVGRTPRLCVSRLASANATVALACPAPT